MPKPGQDIHFGIDDVQKITAPQGSIRPHSIEGLTVNFVESDAGAEIEHEHPEEQLSIVLSGRLRMTVDGHGTFEVGPRELVYMPPNTAHRAEALEDTVLIDLFTPVHEGLMRLSEETAAAEAS